MMLRQLVRPLDKRNLVMVVETFNRFAGIDVSPTQVASDAEATGRAYLKVWADAVSRKLKGDRVKAEFLSLVMLCCDDPRATNKAIADIVRSFEQQVVSSASDDLQQDVTAWNELSRDIARHIGKNAPLEQFLQEMQLRSKEPTPGPQTVVLMTIHGAKGREFDTVYVIGLAEDIMPSFQSRQKGDGSAEMEEERRNCFVAITRTKERLMLSRAETYRGYPKKPSRFLVEMGLVAAASISRGR